MKLMSVAASMLLVGASGLFVLSLAHVDIEKTVEHMQVSTPRLKVASGSVRIFAAGDMLFDRKIRQVSEAYGADYPLSCMKPLIGKADFAVANLEGPITEHPSISLGSVVGSPENFYFTFPTTTASMLARYNFKAVDLGNNHILNFGYSGLASTQTYLSEAGMGYFGGVKENEGVFETEVNGVKLSFVAYNEFGGSSPKDIANTILAEKKEGRKVIVYAHWGDEYIDSSPRLRPVAELFADSGATIIIGAHPHVVLGHEYIGDTLVYYSLGNFIFDQYWQEDVRSGLALILTVSNIGKVSVEEYPLDILRDGRTCPAVQEAVI